MKSLGNRRSYLVAGALAAAGIGALLGLQPALGGEFPGKPLSHAVLALTPGAAAQVVENGDGTAVTFVVAMIGPNLSLGVLDFENDDYTTSVELQPGQGGNQSGSGAGHFVMENVFALDLGTFQFVGPYDVMVDVEVADTTDTAAYVNQGVSMTTDPFSGETHIFRQHVVGNQAYGAVAGAVSVSVDFKDGNGFVLTNEAAGGFGLVAANNIHSREKIK